MSLCLRAWHTCGPKRVITELVLPSTMTEDGEWRQEHPSLLWAVKGSRLASLCLFTLSPTWVGDTTGNVSPRLTPVPATCPLLAVWKGTRFHWDSACVLRCPRVSPSFQLRRDHRAKRLSVFSTVHPKEIHLGILCSLISHIIRFLHLLLSWEIYIN